MYIYNVQMYAPLELDCHLFDYNVIDLLIAQLVPNLE